MANGLFIAGAVAILSAQVNFPSDTIRTMIVDAADYTFNSAHDALDDVPSGARVAIGTLASKTTTGGTFDSADVVLSAVTGDPTEEVHLFEGDGAESAQQLIARWDTGVSVTPNGGNITVQWNALGILDLTP